MMLYLLIYPTITKVNPANVPARRTPPTDIQTDFIDGLPLAGRENAGPVKTHREYTLIALVVYDWLWPLTQAEFCTQKAFDMKDIGN